MRIFLLSGTEWFVLFFGAALLFIVGMFVLVAVIIVKRYRAARAAGLDPFAGDVQLMAQAKNSQLLESADPVARLDSLDELKASGRITDTEYTTLRSQVLGLPQK